MIRLGSIFYQGEPGSYSEAAILNHWPQAKAIGLASFGEVMAQLQSDQSAVGLLPIENAYRGPVYDVLDLFTGASPALEIRAEVVQPVELALLAPPGMELGDVRVVRSHPQALMQSRGFWQPKGWEAEPALDTAGSAREVSESHRPGLAAIASRRAGALYGLNVLASNIHDHTDNRTRFWLIAQKPVGIAASPLGLYKTSIIFDVPNVPGSLVKVLMHFSNGGLNLNKAESRPRPGVPFAFRFWIDVAGSPEHMASVAEQAVQEMEWHRVLGSGYPVLDQ
ncbi:MAG: prephenate dehydratase [Firmicutes bacterium]|nr:prephenate dehydratase [Bacillota bacterium]